MSITEKDDEVYIGSVSPTIGVSQQQGLLDVTKNVMPLLTVGEWIRIMDIYHEAINRVFKENGLEEKDGAKCDK